MALSATAASVPAGSFQPFCRELPDWPVPSSIGELSPQYATRPDPNPLVTTAAPVVPEAEEPDRNTSPRTAELSAGLSVAVVPDRMIVPVTWPNGPAMIGSPAALAPMTFGLSVEMVETSIENPNGSVESTELFVIRSLSIFTESAPSLLRSLPL